MRPTSSSGCGLVLLSAIAATAPPATARADVTGEVVGGVGIPLGDDGHEELVDRAAGIGLRAGYLWMVRGDEDVRLLVGPELAASIDAVGVHEPVDGEEPRRVRVLAGVRALRETTGSFLLGRIGVGLDHWTWDFGDTILAAACLPSVSIDGPAIEGSFGIGVRVGRLRIGGELALAWADHRGDRPRCRELDAVIDVLDNRTLELGLHVVIGAEY